MCASKRAKSHLLLIERPLNSSYTCEYLLPYRLKKKKQNLIASRNINCSRNSDTCLIKFTLFLQCNKSEISILDQLTQQH